MQGQEGWNIEMNKGEFLDMVALSTDTGFNTWQ